MRYINIVQGYLSLIVLTFVYERKNKHTYVINDKSERSNNLCKKLDTTKTSNILKQILLHSFYSPLHFTVSYKSKIIQGRNKIDVFAHKIERNTQKGHHRLYYNTS